MWEFPLVVQSRDFSILHTLFESRVATSFHITTLHFDGKPEAAKKRLQKLKTAGLIGERKRRAYEPSVLFLTRKGFQLLEREGVLSTYPPLTLASLEKRAQVSDITLRHELAVMDVKAAFHSALRRTPVLSLATFSTWPRLHEFEVASHGHGGRTIHMKPDGFLRIHEQEADGGVSEHPPFFLEVDKSNEVQGILVQKARCYLEHYQSGGFAIRQGATRADYKEYPFRVLMVFKSAERRNNTAEGLLKRSPPILTQVCLSTFDEVIADPLGPVWMRPRDYRDAVQGTAYDSERRKNAGHYRGEPGRELLVEQRVQKLSILV